MRPFGLESKMWDKMKIPNFKARAVLIPILLGVCIFVSLWVQHNYNTQLPSDLDIYLFAGQKAVHGLNPYWPFNIGSSFVYPPTALLAFVPLSYLSYSREVWATINTISLLLILSVLSQILSNRLSMTGEIWITAGALFFAPFLEQITIGQVDAFVLLGVVLFAFGVLKPRYQFLGDCGLAIAISFKITPVILAALPLFYRDWQRCKRISVFLLTLVFISVLAFGLEPWFDFFAILPKLFQGYPATVNQAITPSIDWLARHFTSGVNLSWIGTVFSALILTLWVAVLILRNKFKNPIAVISFGIVVMTISPTSIWYHHLVFLLVPIISLLLSADLKNRTGRGIFILILISVLLINSDRIFESLFALPPFASIVGYLVLTLASGLSLISPRSVMAVT
jgi:hypothetical protein